MSDDILPPPAIGKPCGHINRSHCPPGKYTCQDCGAEGYMVPARIHWELPAREVEKTTDGVPFAVGMTVYWRSKDPRTAEGIVVSRIDEAGDPHCVVDGEEWLIPVEWASSKPFDREPEAATDEDVNYALHEYKLYEFPVIVKLCNRIRSDAAKLREERERREEIVSICEQLKHELSTQRAMIDCYVVYQPLYGDRRLVLRSYAEFVETVDYDGQRQPRFSLVEPSYSRSDCKKDSR